MPPPRPSPNYANAPDFGHPRFWTPLIIGVLTAALLIVWYYSAVDIEWLKDQMLSANERVAALSNEQRARMAAAMSRNTMLVSALVSVVLVLPLALALQAVYFLLAGKVTGVQLSYKHWFTMAAWCSLPGVLAALAGMVLMLTEGQPLQISPMQLQVLSLNELFFHRRMGEPGASLPGTLTVVAPWSWALLTICVRTWTQRSWAFSATFALLPSVVWYGGWALVAFK